MATFRQLYHRGKAIMINVANMVVTGSGSSVYRPLAALDYRLVEQTLHRTEQAIQTPGVLSEVDTARLFKVEITSMDHSSPADPQSHATAALIDAEGRVFGKIHVATNAAQQTPARIIK